MNDGEWIAGDWGTSHLRLFLCDARGQVLDSATGPGVGGVPVVGTDPGVLGSSERCEQIYDSLTARWPQKRAVLCGMVGSNIGWTQAPYVPCPATPAAIAEHGVRLRDGLIRIVPGLSCRNRFDAPDFMRGEETQILGVLALEPALQKGRQLLCLPGTHTKWALLNDGVVTEFLTAPTGELFNILSQHSVLVRERGPFDAQSFQKGLEQPVPHLLHRLFETRSRMLAGELEAPHAASFLSGLLIASDIAGALEIFASTGVHLVGSPDLTRLYAEALHHRQCTSSATDGSAASLAGLIQIYNR